jgi:hypothetical protein
VKAAHAAEPKLRIAMTRRVILGFAELAEGQG